MGGGGWEPAWSVGVPPALLAEADEEDHKATLKYPAPVVRPPRPPLWRLLPHSMAVGVVLAAAFLLLFGDDLVPTATASRAVHAVAAAGPGDPSSQPEASAAAQAVAAIPQEAEPTLDPCASPRAADWPAGLCAWVVARSRGEDLAPGPSTRDVQAFLFRQGLSRVRGRVVGEPAEGGLRQAVVQGTWGYCVVLATPPGSDGSFLAWMRRRAEPATLVVGGRDTTCVAMDEDPVGAVGELVYMRGGPESAELAKRILASL